MKLFTKIFKLFLPIIIFAIAIFLTFRILPQTFFQQDEWSTFGGYIYRESVGGIKKVFLDTFTVHGKVHVNPIMEMSYYLLFKLFGLNFPGYAWVSIMVHFINAVLVYYFSTLLIKNKYLSILVATLFSLNSISHQAVTWISASLQTQGAILFSLLFSILFLNYLAQEKNNRKLLYLSLISIFLALMFKETALPFFLLPVFIVLYSKEKSIKHFKKILIPVGVALIMYLFLRIVIFINAQPIVQNLTEVLEQPNPVVHVYRFLTLPFKVLSESIFPTSWLLGFSKMITRLAYPHFVARDGIPNPYLVETAGLDLINYFLSFLILVIFFICFRFFKKQKRDEFALALVISLFIIVGSTVLVIFIPGKAGYVSIIEPRHLYGATVGSNLFLVLAGYALFSFSTKKTDKAIFLTTILIMLVIVGHSKLVQQELILLKKRSDLRKSFLVTVKNSYPVLPKKAVFYLQSDQAYYGMPAEETNLPVQSGFGRMLMVWYQETERFPSCFYQDVFLHDLIAQGYRECDDRGFGYFRDYEKLVTCLEENHLPLENVFAFSWQGKTEEFKDITAEIRKKLKNE